MGEKPTDSLAEILVRYAGTGEEHHKKQSGDYITFLANYCILIRSNNKRSPQEVSRKLGIESSRISVT